MKVLSIAGYSQTGKTTLTVNLIKELKKRGHTVSSIKDIHFDDFTMETPGTNSWKHWEASDDTVFARSHKETYQIWHRSLSLKEMLSHLDTEWVIVEGMKEAPLPRIICAESEQQVSELLDDTVIAISGKIAESGLSTKAVPLLHSERDIQRIADIVEQRVFEVLPLADPECCSRCGTDCMGMTKAILKGEKKREDCLTDRKKDVSIFIDEEELVVVPFVQDVLKGVIEGFLSNLKGYKKGRIKIEL
ncbi:MAG TPA: molybdopterin-guanine dinucleotide biosynthesis protein B [Candidatus Cloacimonadota bacterium]|nr:molybdopterin-guanine dinucleotide biosynthesis protein B [Candidatus Cloacimonadota bacterium]HPT72968.1 molybdopterin-guanine dinucleotide biosynthesis protein B [Candidatus Cloacimonadota bacterium]